MTKNRKRPAMQMSREISPEELGVDRFRNRDVLAFRYKIDPDGNINECWAQRPSEYIGAGVQLFASDFEAVSPDGYHPTVEEHEAIAAQMAHVIKAMLDIYELGTNDLPGPIWKKRGKKRLRKELRRANLRIAQLEAEMFDARLRAARSPDPLIVDVETVLLDHTLPNAQARVKAALAIIEATRK